MPEMPKSNKPVQLDDTESVEPTGGVVPLSMIHKTPQQTQSTSNLANRGAKRAEIAKPQSLTLIGKCFFCNCSNCDNLLKRRSLETDVPVEAGRVKRGPNRQNARRTRLVGDVNGRVP